MAARRCEVRGWRREVILHGQRFEDFEGGIIFDISHVECHWVIHFVKKLGRWTGPKVEGVIGIGFGVAIVGSRFGAVWGCKDEREVVAVEERVFLENVHVEIVHGGVRQVDGCRFFVNVK